MMHVKMEELPAELRLDFDDGKFECKSYSNGYDASFKDDSDNYIHRTQLLKFVIDDYDNHSNFRWKINGEKGGHNDW